MNQVILKDEYEKRIELIPFETEDIILFEKWINKEYIYKWFCDEEGEDEKQAWLEEVRNRPNHYYHYILMYQDVKIGFAQLIDLHHEQEYSLEIYQKTFSLGEAYELGYCIGEESYLGKGLGKLMVLELERKARLLGGKLILADPAEGNVASIRTLLSAGFMKIKDGDYRKML